MKTIYRILKEDHKSDVMYGELFLLITTSCIYAYVRTKLTDQEPCSRDPGP